MNEEPQMMTIHRSIRRIAAVTAMLGSVAWAAACSGNSSATETGAGAACTTGMGGTGTGGTGTGGTGTGGTTSYDPLPDTAKGPAIPSSGYLVQEINSKLYWVTEGAYQAMFLVTGSGVILVDAPPTIGKNLVQAIKDVTSEPVTHLVYSHHHNDHIGSAGLFPGVTIIAQEETAALLVRDADPNRPVPTVTFKDTYTLTVGTQTLQLDYKGSNHEPGNIFIYAPQQKVLMFVDVIFPGWVPFKYLAVSQDIPGWIGAHQQVLSYDFTTLVSGHLTRLGTKADVQTQLDYVNDLKANAANALETVDLAAVTKSADPANKWLIFELYLGAVAQKCADDTLVKWRGKLGAADMWTKDHCWTMQETLRID